MARNSSFAENSNDCLKVLNILSLQSIRKFNSTEKVEKVKDQFESDLIKSFFSKRKYFKFDRHEMGHKLIWVN